MAAEFQISRRVEFAETDMAGIMHFSNFFRFVEVCEHEFYRSLGYAIHGSDGEPGWPRVHASCDFRAPLRYGDLATVHLLILEVRSRSIRYAFRVLTPDGAVAAAGRLTVVCVAAGAEGMKATPIPAEMAAKLQAVTDDRLQQLGLTR